MNIQEYKKNPCEESSLPFWKAEAIKIPGSMKIVNDNNIDIEMFSEYKDEPYFKLSHCMKDIEKPLLDDEFEMNSGDVEDYAKHIMECYGLGNEFVDELAAYEFHSVYNPDLWVLIKEKKTNRIVASGIAEFDQRIGEGVFEWIQVSSNYRRKGLGKNVVEELLWRMKDIAYFVTVSGIVNNETNPLALYESCGFGNKVIWHVLNKK